jgi:molecular chaperone GrpE
MADTNGKTEVNDRLELEEHPEDADTLTPVAAETTAQDEIKKIQAERDALYDRLARQQADLENYRKRVEKEKNDFREFAVADVLKSILPVLDTFNLALRAQGSGDDLRKGVELIRKQLEDVLAKAGVQPISAPGQQFDPHVHEAIEMVESSDVRDNHVLEELQRGYKFKERLLRPAMVRVAKNSKK